MDLCQAVKSGRPFRLPGSHWIDRNESGVLCTVDISGGKSPRYFYHDDFRFDVWEVCEPQPQAVQTPIQKINAACDLLREALLESLGTK